MMMTDLNKLKILLSYLYRGIEKRSEEVISLYGYCKDFGIDWEETVESICDGSNNVVYTMDTYHDSSCYLGKKNRCICPYGNFAGRVQLPIELFLCTDENYKELIKSDQHIIESKEDIYNKSILLQRQKEEVENSIKAKELQLLEDLKKKYE